MKIADIEKILWEEHQISRDTFWRDRNIKIKDTSSIPTDRLDIYAALFGITPDELKNYQVKIKPLSERNSSDKSKAKSIAGLKSKS